MTKIEKFFMVLSVILIIIGVAATIYGILYCAYPSWFCEEHLYWYGTCIYCGATQN